VNGALSNDTAYVRLGALPLQERDGANTVTREFLWQGGQLGGIGELLQIHQAGQDFNCFYNSRGDVIMVLDGSQAAVASYDYEPFGLPLAKSGSLDQPARFSTKSYDEKT